MRRSSVSRFRRPSNVILLVGVMLSLTFFVFCYFTMRSTRDTTTISTNPDDIDDGRTQQRRPLIKERPARYRQQQNGMTLAEVQREQREALAAYRSKYGSKQEERPAEVPDNVDAPPAETQAEYEEEAPKKPVPLNDLPPLPKDQVNQPPSGLRIAIISAYQGSRYDYMAKLSGETKKKYAKMHGYTFIEDNDLIPVDATWNQRSAIRTKCFTTHMDDFDYMFWMDVDIFITNPFVTIEELIQMGRGAHVICSKDWGNRQLNPGSMIVKSSEFTRTFIAEWEAAIERVTDDLRAFQEVMKQHPDWEARKIRFIDQAALNPYHDVETQNGAISPKPRPDPNGHELWTPDALLVHIVNCLRTSRGDCHLLANHFYRIAEKQFELAGYPLIPYLDQDGAQE